MNTILQCLIHSPIIREYFASKMYKKHYNKAILERGDAFIADGFAEYIEKYDKKDEDVSSAIRTLKSTIGNVLTLYKISEQHDSHEVRIA